MGELAISDKLHFQVFDGHGGTDAASFIRKNILQFITEDSHFPDGVKRALKNAFVKADHALADAKNLDQSSGTTALIALVLGRSEIYFDIQIHTPYSLNFVFLLS